MGSGNKVTTPSTSPPHVLQMKEIKIHHHTTSQCMKSKIQQTKVLNCLAQGRAMVKCQTRNRKFSSSNHLNINTMTQNVKSNSMFIFLLMVFTHAEKSFLQTHSSVILIHQNNVHVGKRRGFCWFSWNSYFIGRYRYVERHSEIGMRRIS